MSNSDLIVFLSFIFYSWPRSCQQRRIFYCASDSLWDPVQSLWQYVTHNNIQWLFCCHIL